MSRELELPNDNRAIEAARLDEVARLSIDRVAAELADIIGLRRTAVIGGVKETRRVREWMGAKRQPQRPEALRTALQAARLIAHADDKDVARAWFTGCNQHLSFEAPMMVLAESDAPETYTRVVRAAAEFASRS